MKPEQEARGDYEYIRHGSYPFQKFCPICFCFVKYATTIRFTKTSNQNHAKWKRKKMVIRGFLKNTGKNAGNDEISAEEMLEDINYTIENFDI